MEERQGHMRLCCWRAGSAAQWCWQYLVDGLYCFHLLLEMLLRYMVFIIYYFDGIPHLCEWAGAVNNRCELTEWVPFSISDNFPYLFIGYEVSLTGLLADRPVSPITLTKYLSAIRCPHWNSMLCLVWTVEVFGIHASAACRMACVALVTMVSPTVSTIPRKVAQSALLKLNLGGRGMEGDVACVRDADGQVVTFVWVVDDLPR